MGTKTLNILTVNAGSSSVKLSLFSNYSSAVQFSDKPKSVVFDDISDISKLKHSIDEWLDQLMQDEQINAVGHRIVLGGPNRSSATRVTPATIHELATYENIDPEHLPLELNLVKQIGHILPDVLQVACFDTAFFNNLPATASTLPLPKKYRSKELRRYGYHGLSYSYLQSEFKKIAGEAAVNGRVIYAHLGSGSSLAATLDSKPVDMTMGFSPASGVVMSTRTGDIDPGLAYYFNKQHGLNAEQFNHMVNFESGLLGVSGKTGSMIDLLNLESHDEAAAEAVQLFVYQVRKAIGSLSAVLGGLDSLVFTGGIGEKSAILRQRICSDFDYLGINLDNHRNDSNSELISSNGSQVGVHVIPANEALVMVRQIADSINIEEPN